MKLRCIVPMGPFKRGKFYDVVEILELPDHAMARKPNGKWPRPGDPYFCWHADEIFEPAPQGIPAYHCGYEYFDQEFFGVIIPDSVFSITRSRRLCDLTPSEKRVDDAVSDISGNRLWWRLFHHIVTGVCWPTDLQPNFLLIGIDHKHLGRKYSYRHVERDIRQILRRLKIPTSKTTPVEDQQPEFWYRSSWRKAGPWTWIPPKPPGQ